ncbi:MAG: hypothetical protein ACP5JG_10500 [Anaerolineae bacterium]
MTQHTFSTRDRQTLMDGVPFLVKGLRCSNGLVSDEATDELIAHLLLFADFDVNAVSVFFMGSRFGDVKGYREDATLDPAYAKRMARIIEAADDQAMAVLVGCLYWGDSKAKWASWTQDEANGAVRNTVAWLADHDYRNVFVDVDNEGMARRAKGLDNRAMVLAGKEVDPTCVIGTNFRGEPPDEADLALHFAEPVPGKPYIESEGSPPGVEGGYWGAYSKREGFYGYLNVGVYTSEMKASQIEATREHLEMSHGYMLASTWLQAPPPQGPNHRPGGKGTPGDPGVLWWLRWLREEQGPHRVS